MEITKYADGSLKLWFADEDDYELTEKNGVNVWITKEDVERIKRT